MDSRSSLKSIWNITVPSELCDGNTFSSSPIPAYFKYMALFDNRNQPIPLNVLRKAGMENSDTIECQPRYLMYVTFSYANKENFQVGVYHEFPGELLDDLIKRSTHEWEWYLFNYMASQNGAEWAIRHIKEWAPGVLKRLEIK